MKPESKQPSCAVGDHVQLTIGGPIMVVTGTRMCTGGIEVVSCSWFSTLNELHYADFVADILVRA